MIHKIAILSNQATISAQNVLIALDMNPDTLPNESSSLLLKDRVQLAEKEHIANVLVMTDGKINKAAEILGLERTTLFKKMKKYGMKKIIGNA